MPLTEIEIYRQAPCVLNYDQHQETMRNQLKAGAIVFWFAKLLLWKNTISMKEKKEMEKYKYPKKRLLYFIYLSFIYDKGSDSEYFSVWGELPIVFFPSFQAV